MIFDIKGKVALITGGANGIGLCYSKELLKNGLKYLAILDIDASAGAKTMEQFNVEFGKNKVQFFNADVSKEDEFESAFKIIVATFKSLDIVINNAGIFNDSEWEKTLAINCGAVVRGSLLAMKYMDKNRGGKGGVVVNIASNFGLQGFDASPVYAASKHFVIGLDRSLGTSYFYNQTGVKFLTWCPAFTTTSMVTEVEGTALAGFSGHGTYLAEQLKNLPAQTPEDAARGIITLITKGENGSVWVVESGEFYEVEIPDRNTLRKK